MSWNGTVRCSYCYHKGHNRTGCAELAKHMKELLKDNPEDWRAKEYFAKKKRTCGYCKNTGHNRKTCQEASQDRNHFIAQNRDARKKALKWLKSSGVGVGTLIKRNSHYDGEYLALVEQVKWARINAQTVVVDENEVGIPDISCLIVAKVDGSSSRCSANPRNTEVVGTIPVRLVSAQVPYNWLASEDEPTLSNIEEALKQDDMDYIRRYILRTEPTSW